MGMIKFQDGRGKGIKKKGMIDATHPNGTHRALVLILGGGYTNVHYLKNYVLYSVFHKK